MLYKDQVLLNFTLFSYPSFQFNKHLLKTCFPGTLLTLGIQRWCWRAWKFSSKRWHETEILGIQWDLQWGFDILILPLALYFLGPLSKKAIYTRTGADGKMKCQLYHHWSNAQHLQTQSFSNRLCWPQDLGLMAKVGLPNPNPLNL